MKTLLLFIFCTFYLFIFSQPCSLVEITASTRLTLPECNQNDGLVLVTSPQGGTPPYSYNLNGVTSEFGAFPDLEVGIYQLTITDSRGCSDTLLVNLTYRNIDEIIKPNNAFTPNGDDINDRWIIPGIESFSGSEVRVFNRWGQLVHQNNEYANEFGWDGNHGGSKAPNGTYYYVISILNNCVEEYLKGTVTIIR